MTNLEFRQALKNGNTDVIYIDIDGTEYTHTILKAGKKEVTLRNNFLERDYKIYFGNMIEGHDNIRFKIK